MSDQKSSEIENKEKPQGILKPNHMTLFNRQLPNNQPSRKTVKFHHQSGDSSSIEWNNPSNSQINERYHQEQSYQQSNWKSKEREDSNQQRLDILSNQVAQKINGPQKVNDYNLNAKISIEKLDKDNKLIQQQQMTGQQKDLENQNSKEDLAAKVDKIEMQVNSIENQVKDLKEAQKEDKKEINEVKSELKITKQEIKEVKSELKITNQEIKEVKSELKITNQAINRIEKLLLHLYPEQNSNMFGLKLVDTLKSQQQCVKKFSNQLPIIQNLSLKDDVVSYLQSIFNNNLNFDDFLKMIEDDLFFEVEIDGIIGRVIALNSSFISNPSSKTGIIAFDQHDDNLPQRLPNFCSKKEKILLQVTSLTKYASLLKKSIISQQDAFHQ